VPADVSVATGHSTTMPGMAFHIVTGFLQIPGTDEFDWQLARVVFVDVS